MPIAKACSAQISVNASRCAPGGKSYRSPCQCSTGVPSASGASGESAPSGHSHGHDHGFDGGWRLWAGDPILRAVLAAVVVTAVATIIGVVALWPTGEGRRTAIANADEIGLVTMSHVKFVLRIVRQVSAQREKKRSTMSCSHS